MGALKETTSVLAGLALALATPVAVHQGIDEGLFGAEHSERSDNEEVKSFQRNQINGDLKKAQSLVTQKEQLQTQRIKISETAIVKGKTREEAAELALPVMQKIQQVNYDLNQLEKGFTGRIYSNTSLSEEFLENAMYSFKQTVPDSGVQEDNARYISKCQWQVKPNAISIDYSDTDISDVKECADDSSANPGMDIMAAALAIGSLFLLQIPFFIGSGLTESAFNGVESIRRRRRDKKAKQPKNN